MLVRCLLIASFLLATQLAPQAYAHEVRPAYLQLTEQGDGSWTVMWKQPLLEGRQLPLKPSFDPACELEPSRPPEFAGNSTLAHYTAHCPLHEARLTIDGLSATLTDVLVRVDRNDGSTANHLLRSSSPSTDLSSKAPAAGSYLIMGIEHLLLGIDHVLFVVGLVLLIPGRLDLLKTITAFTVAHSITLALSVLELVRVPQAPVEAVIALSILFLARELLMPVDRRSILTRASPWIMAMLFGLLHGFGFAGVLAEIGLPKDQLALSLLLFNVGIEIGQVLVILVMLLLMRGLTRLTVSGLPQTAYVWVMGCVAGMWTLDRVSMIFL